MNETSNIREKIAKLLKKAESAKEVDSLHEAEIFAAKANKLLMEYNLSMDDIDMKEKQRTIESITVDIESIKTEGDWVKTLYGVIARNNLCRVINYINTGRIEIFGEKENVEMVMYMASSLRETIKNGFSARWKSYTGTEKRGTYKRGYLGGAVIGINIKLTEQRAELAKELIGVTALVRTNEIALADKISEKFPNLRKGRATRSSSMDGRSQGVNDGKNMNVNKAIN